MTETATLASDPVLQALCPLSLQMRRSGGSVVGRGTELEAIESELESARKGLTVVTLEGEPGIGKTRLLVAAHQLATDHEFTPVAVAADEELRGPFLLMRSILSAGSAGEAVAGTDGEDTVKRAVLALSGRSAPGLESLPADQKLLRQFDLTALALRAIASSRPLA